jgi:hypothetical protein
VARNGESELTSVSLTDHQVRDLMERMLKGSGRRLDMSSPLWTPFVAGGRPGAGDAPTGPVLHWRGHLLPGFQFLAAGRLHPTVAAKFARAGERLAAAQGHGHRSGARTRRLVAWAADQTAAQRT